MQIPRTFAILFLLIAGPRALADITLTIDPGEIARHNTPITAKLSPDNAAALANKTSATLKSEDNQHIPAQIITTPDAIELRFIEPSLEARRAKTYHLAPADHPAEGFHFADAPDHRDLLFADQPLFRHMIPTYDPDNRDATLKPFHHLFGLHDEGFITKGAGGLETHHRGLFFGYKNQYGNFWTNTDCDQRHVNYLKDREFTGPVAARSASITGWHAKDGKLVARDTREVTAWRIAPDQYILDFDINLESLAGDLQLSGDPHHGGFQFRAAEEVQGASTTKPSVHAGLAKYIRPVSSKLVKDDNYSDTPWAAELFTIKGNPYVIMHLDHPDNPRPTTYSMRPYGRFGAFFTTTVPQGKPLHLRYRIVYLDGKTHPNPSADSLAPFYEDFASPPKVTVQRSW